MAIRSNLIRCFPRLVLGLVLAELVRQLNILFQRRLKGYFGRLAQNERRRRSFLIATGATSNKVSNLNNNSDAIPTQSVAGLLKDKDPDKEEEKDKEHYHDVRKPDTERKWLTTAFTTLKAQVRKDSTKLEKEKEVFADALPTATPSAGSFLQVDWKSESQPPSQPPLISKTTKRIYSRLVGAREKNQHEPYVHAPVDDIYRDIDEEEESRRISKPLGVVLMTVGLLIFYTICGAYIVTLFETKWAFFKGVWFLFISVMTVGYGDVTPSNSEFLTYFIPYLIFGMSIFGNLVGLVMMFVSNLTGRMKTIGKSFYDVYSAKTQIHKIQKKSRRARRWWQILHQHIKRGLPDKMVDESAMYKARLFGKEREFIKEAFRIYFKLVYEERMKRMEIKPPPQKRPRAPGAVPAKSALKIQEHHIHEVTKTLPLRKKYSRWERFKQYSRRKYANAQFYFSPEPDDYL